MEEWTQIAVSIARMEEKLDAMLSAQGRLFSGVEKLEERVVQLERQRSWAMGFSAAVAAVVAWLVDIFRGTH